MNRGMTVDATLSAVKQSKGETATDKEIFQAQVVGWCIEWLQACFLVLDDIMDDSITRRGQPCWYKNADVKQKAINDGLILESCIYTLLKKHLKGSSAYHAIVDMFHEISWQTQLGQLLDMTTEAADGSLDFTRFTTERYKLIVKYKTAFYSFYMPVAAGLTLAGLTGDKEMETTRAITLAMGEYFQIQDDVLDCYGDPATIGKIGTDIQDKKCSWLCVQALSRCTPEQRKLMQDNYGQHDEAKVAAIKALYKEMKLKEAFDAYEEESYKQIRTLIDTCEGVPKAAFEGLLAKIYKRKL
jgi:farnesyl diphosphate synthase